MRDRQAATEGAAKTRRSTRVASAAPEAVPIAQAVSTGRSRSKASERGRGRGKGLVTIPQAAVEEDENDIIPAVEPPVAIPPATRPRTQGGRRSTRPPTLSTLLFNALSGWFSFRPWTSFPPHATFLEKVYHIMRFLRSGPLFPILAILAALATILFYRDPFSRGLRGAMPSRWYWDRSSQGSYTAPWGDPETQDALFERLKTLERIMQQYTQEHVAGSRINHPELEQEVNEWHKLSSAFHKHTSTANVAVATGVAQLQTKYNDLLDMTNKLKNNINGQDGLIEGIRTELDSKIKPQIDSISKGVTSVQNMFNTLEKNLPSTIAIKVDALGNLEIPDSFYTAMREFFKQQYPAVRGGKSVQGAVEQRWRWDDWLEYNRWQLLSWVDNAAEKQLENKIKPHVVSREEFMHVLKEEVKKLEEALDSVGSTTSGHISQHEAKLIFLRKQIGLVSDRVNSIAENTARKEVGKGAGLKPADWAESKLGEYLAEGLHSQYTAKLADYAAFAGGAFIDPARTSATFSNHPGRKAFGWIHWFLGADKYIPKPKIVISSLELEPGSCWPLEGRKGILGLILREPVHVKGITLQHIEWSRALFKDSAPRKISLWISVFDTEKERELAEMSAISLTSPKDRKRPDPEDLWGQKGPLSGFVKVGNWKYDFDDRSPAEQTFSVPLELRRMNITSDRVVVAVDDNYGNDMYTCIYRVRVHGDPAVKRMWRKEEDGDYWTELKVMGGDVADDVSADGDSSR